MSAERPPQRAATAVPDDGKPRPRPIDGDDPRDVAEWVRMRAALHGASDDHRREAREFIEGRFPPYGVFVVTRAEGGLCGYVEVGERPYAEGCDSSPVGYVESWWVDEDLRGRGIGRALIAAAEGWARARGRTEIASDALLDNPVSHAAHRALGFLEVERIVCFRKPL